MPHMGEKVEYPVGRGSARSVTVSASPFTFTAPADGNVVISGGTISVIEYGRGNTFYGAGFVGGPVYIANGDKIRLTYLTAPTITFFPM